MCSIPGIGPICAGSTRAWRGSGRHLPSAKSAAAFVGSNPSNWESGLSASPSRPITKQGPAELLLAYYQAANIARRHAPDLAAFYRKLMVNRNHNHIKANFAVARKLACRPGPFCKPGSHISSAISMAKRSTSPAQPPLPPPWRCPTTSLAGPGRTPSEAGLANSDKSAERADHQ
ncbi:MAG: transposase [Actinomycetota bacterium]|nr:transposase [Actinomycetota bacterium]